MNRRQLLKTVSLLSLVACLPVMASPPAPERFAVYRLVDKCGYGHEQIPLSSLKKDDIFFLCDEKHEVSPWGCASRDAVAYPDEQFFAMEVQPAEPPTDGTKEWTEEHKAFLAKAFRTA